MSTERRHQSTLPSELESDTIVRMTLGQVAYTMPWAMWVDNDRRCWLNPQYPVQSTPAGTSQMRIELLDDGYHVRAPRGETWTPQEKATYYGQEDIEFIPVAALIF